MRILVTGSAGFIGSHVVTAARDAGHDVSECDPRTNIDLQTWVKVDGSHYDLVVHCAAAIVTVAAKAAAGAAIAENLEIDAALFRWAARTKPGRVVYYSSSCVYPVTLAQPGRKLAERHISLRHPQWPDGLYGWVKLTGECLAQQLAADGVPVTIVRPFSVYGPGMAEGFAVSGFVAQAKQHGDPIVIWGNDEQTRDFIHVTDVAAATLAAAEQCIDGPVNLGTGEPTSLRELAGLVSTAAGYWPTLKVASDLPAGVPSLVADTTRLRTFYEPKVTLEDGLRGMLA